VLKTVLIKIAELGEMVQWVPPVESGPRIEAFKLRPMNSTRVSKIEGFAEDIATALRRDNVLVKRMPGQGVVCVFVPKQEPVHPTWLSLIEQAHGELGTQRVPVLFGLDWLGKPYVEDLTEMPHLLVGGSTGGGKSVFVRSVLTTMMNYLSPKEVRFVLSDTKGVEFTEFDEAKHLLFPRAQSVKKTIDYMELLHTETDARLAGFGMGGHKNIREYNAAHKDIPGQTRPYIVLVIDELADIMYDPTAKKGEKYHGAEELDYITRKSRAAGIHVIAAVQRPSVDVVKGVIKNNFPARVSFKTPSAVDSKVILDTNGAEQLMDIGDMLYKRGPGLVRLHSGYTTSSDIRSMLEYVNCYKEA